MSSAVSLQDFSVGEKVWIVDEKSNFNFSIFETTVTKVGRKYVAVDSYNELPHPCGVSYGKWYLSSRDSCLFPTGLPAVRTTMAGSHSHYSSAAYAA